MMSRDIIPFIRRKDYQLVRELGEGACGKTVLLYDELIDQHIVCKKYQPYSESERTALFLNFLREIKLLHQVLHDNVVRIYNYYVYPELEAGYILMEYIKGADVRTYLKQFPEKAASIFEQAIDGFAYLESCGILHRDIRPLNILVRDDGVLKIIDLGFAKKILKSDDYDKSISLNWWCQTPEEFQNGRYDFATEVYFVGKLFQQIVTENNIEYFPYMEILRLMCCHAPGERASTFRFVLDRLHANQFSEIVFTEDEIDRYRGFSNAMQSYFTKIESNTHYEDDVDLIIRLLENMYRSVMLEVWVPDAGAVFGRFVKGSYYFNRRSLLSVTVLRGFLALLKNCSHEKKRIILSNLASTLDAIPRYVSEEDDDIPF